jgi:hypothetical protein
MVLLKFPLVMKGFSRSSVNDFANKYPHLGGVNGWLLKEGRFCRCLLQSAKYFPLSVN